MNTAASSDDKQPRNKGRESVEEALSDKKVIEGTNGSTEKRGRGDSPGGTFTPAPGTASKPKDREAREDSAAPNAPSSRAETLISPSRSFESRQTLCQGQTPPDDGAQTPCSTSGTPPPMPTMSNPSSLKTPDTAGRQTPSTPRTTPQAAPHISHTESIRRKPVPASSRDKPGEGSDGRASAARNPLEKATVTIVPELLGGKAPLTPDPRPRTRVSLPGRRRRTGWGRVVRVGRLWWVEGVWCCVSLLCIAIIFAVLSAYDNHPLLSLPLHLSALLAFLTTLSTLALLLPVAECISQWKWNHLRADTSSLSDFQLFDSASRSPLGAAALLFRLRHRSLASFGAVVGLLAVLGPAVSQVAVGYRESEVVAEGEASVRSVRVLEGDVQGLRGAVEDGVKGGVGVRFPVVCETGQCRFDPFQGLGICAKVRDVTDRLTVVTTRSIERNSTAGSPARFTRTYNVSLPQSANCRLTTSQPLNILTCKTNGSSTLSFDGGVADTAIYSMPVIYSNPKGTEEDAEVEFKALDVLFHLCLNTYSASVRDGKPKFSTVGTSSSLAPGSLGEEVDVECGEPVSESEVECVVGDLPSGAFMRLEDRGGNGDGEVGAQFRALAGIAVAIGEGMSGLWMSNGDVSIILGTRIMEAISRVLYDGEEGEQRNRVEKMAEGVANGLTNAIYATPNTQSHPGTALTLQTLTKINYPALTLLVLISLSSAAFLLLTAALTDRGPGAEVLKSSALAALFALEEECRDVAGGLEDVGSMGRTARVMHVRLRDGDIVLAGEGGEAVRRVRKSEV